MLGGAAVHGAGSAPTTAARRSSEAVASDVLGLVGDTPLLRIRAAAGRDVIAKVEAANPGGSMKDRTAAHMLRGAMQRGELRPGGRVVESTSGNFGVGLAQAAAVLGLRLTCVVDPRCSAANRRAMAALGADVDLVETPDAASGDFLTARLARVQELLEVHPGAFWPDQYASTLNPQAHALGTMAEIDDALGDEIDALYVATSTTGTLRGCQQLLAERGRCTRVVAVDAVGSVLFGGDRGPRTLPGYGAGCTPPLARDAHPDDVVRVSELDAIRWCRRIARTDGLLVGASGGAVVAAAAEAGRDGERAVVILPDRGVTYLETVYHDDWVAATYGDEALLELQRDAA